MDSTLLEFQRSLSEVKKLIEFFNLEKKLLSITTNNGLPNDIIINELSTKIKEFRLSKLKFNYNSIIISLYGAFEKFIENCLTSYVEAINSIIPDYKNLPEAIIKGHVRLSVDLLAKVENVKYSGPLSKEIIIKNLNQCLNTVDDYILNKDAFSQHSANFRLQLIDECFNQTGVQDINSKVLTIKEFNDFISEIGGIQNPIKAESFQKINELAEYRNSVAHGVETEIIDNEILLEFVKYFEKYAEALCKILDHEILYFNILHTGINLGKLTGFYRGGLVICFFSQGERIEIGQKLYGMNSNKTISISKIESIQLNDVSYDAISRPDSVDIGVTLDSAFKDNFQVYLLPK